MNATLRAAGDAVTIPGGHLCTYSTSQEVAPDPTNIPWPPSDAVRMSVMLLLGIKSAHKLIPSQQTG